MPTIINHFQNFTDILNLIMIIIFFIIGIWGGFNFKGFLYVALLPVCLLLFSKAFPLLSPEMLNGLMNYIFAIGIGYLSATSAKWIGNKFLFR